MTAVGPSPEAARSEPVASAKPSGFVVGELPAPLNFGFEGVAMFSTELSSRSVESPSSIRLGMPRTGVNSAGSSSLESAKRLLRIGGPSSSSLESPKRLEKRELGFESTGFGLEALPKPNREGDFGRFESSDPRTVARAGFPESIESRIDVRIPLAPGPTELNGRRAMEPAGDDVRPLNDWLVARDWGRASTDEGLIVRFMLYLFEVELGVEDRAFLKLLEESLSFRPNLGFAIGFLFFGWGSTGFREVAGVPADAARE